MSRTEMADARAAVSPHVRRTPVVEVHARELGLGDFTLVFKLEYLQHSGSFKARGAFANMLLREVPEAGVVAASGGNHGVAVAYAAMRLGVRAKVFIPTIASPAKIARIRGYGAELVVGGDRYDNARIASEEWAAGSGAMRVHPFDQKETLLGTSTLAAELQEQAPDATTVMVAVGGGGLIGGIASWYQDGVSIVGVEPEGAPTLTKALEAGEPVDAETGSVAADSLAPKRVGTLMFPIAQQYVSSILLVPDEAIVEAQRKLWDVLRIVAEPGGATALAALLARRYIPRDGERVAVIICGANTDAVSL